MPPTSSSGQCPVLRPLRPSRRAFARLAAALGAAAMLAAPGAAMAQQKGGSITVGLETDVTGFDAVAGGVLGQTGEIVMRTIQEPLLDFDPDTKEVKPLLATAWEANEDLTQYTFTLREGVKFHDGTEFTAEDVAAHYNRILDPEQKSRSRSFISVIQGAEALDRYTVRFTLAHPWGAFLPYLAATSMSGPIPARANVEAGEQNRRPIGTGPFEFVSWLGGDRIVVKRFEDYWAKDEIHLDEVVFRILPDTQTRFASLKSGEVDVIWIDRGQTIVSAQKDEEIVSLQTQGAGAEIILLNARNAPLDDVRVRRALAHAFNQPAAVKIIWQDTKPVVSSPMGDSRDCGEAGLRGYDPKAAKALVEDYGQPIKLSMVHTATPRGREIGELVQQMSKAVGIEVELIPVDQGTLIKRTFGREFDIVGWRIADAVDVGPQLFALARSDSSYNLTGYSSPELDDLAQRMRTAKDVDERFELQCQIVAEMNDQATMLYWGGGAFYAFTTQRVKGVPPPYRGAVDVTRAWVEE
ncbi:MAG: ABC transporter substrate-binding protein [Albimonas sp.]|uniref:ABC transporter substrate-binding protein n=1 Tax=Albimonas sp. TaxID=1872425 RepID=UPI00405710D6